jgi:hypothetical protein
MINYFQHSLAIHTQKFTYVIALMGFFVFVPVYPLSNQQPTTNNATVQLIKAIFGQVYFKHKDYKPRIFEQFKAGASYEQTADHINAKRQEYQKQQNHANAFICDEALNVLTTSREAYSKSQSALSLIPGGKNS